MQQENCVDERSETQYYCDNRLVHFITAIINYSLHEAIPYRICWLVKTELDARRSVGVVVEQISISHD